MEWSEQTNGHGFSDGQDASTLFDSAGNSAQDAQGLFDSPAEPANAVPPVTSASGWSDGEDDLFFEDETPKKESEQNREVESSQAPVANDEVETVPAGEFLPASAIDLSAEIKLREDRTPIVSNESVAVFDKVDSSLPPQGISPSHEAVSVTATAPADVYSEQDQANHEQYYQPGQDQQYVQPNHEQQQFQMSQELQPNQEQQQFQISQELQPNQEQQQFQMSQELQPNQEQQQFQMSQELQPNQEHQQFQMSQDQQQYQEQQQFEMSQELQPNQEQQQFEMSQDQQQYQEQQQFEMSQDQQQYQEQHSSSQVELATSTQDLASTQQATAADEYFASRERESAFQEFERASDPSSVPPQEEFQNNGQTGEYATDVTTPFGNSDSVTSTSEVQHGSGFGESYDSASPAATELEENLQQQIHGHPVVDQAMNSNSETTDISDTWANQTNETSTKDANHIAKLGMAQMVAEEIEQSHSPSNLELQVATAGEDYTNESKAVQEVFNRATEKIAEASADAVTTSPRVTSSYEQVPGLSGTEFNLVSDVQLGTGMAPGSHVVGHHSQRELYSNGDEKLDEVPSSSLVFDTATLGMARMEADMIENTMDVASSQLLDGSQPHQVELSNHDSSPTDSKQVSEMFNDESEDIADKVANISLSQENAMDLPAGQPSPPPPVFQVSPTLANQFGSDNGETAEFFKQGIQSSYDDTQQQQSSFDGPARTEQNASPPPPVASGLFSQEPSPDMTNPNEAFPSSPPHSHRPPPVDTQPPLVESVKDPKTIVSPVIVDANGNMSPVHTSDELFANVDTSASGVFGSSPIHQQHQNANQSGNNDEQELPDFYTLGSPGERALNGESRGREKRSDSIASDVFNAPVSSAPVLNEFQREDQDAADWMGNEKDEFPQMHATGNENTHGQSLDTIPQDLTSNQQQQQPMGGVPQYAQDGQQQYYQGGVVPQGTSSGEHFHQDNYQQPAYSGQEQYQQSGTHNFQQYGEQQYYDPQASHGGYNAYNGGNANGAEFGLEMNDNMDATAAAISATLPPAMMPPPKPRVRTKEGRPAHALVSFGFGGKLVTMLPMPKMALSGSSRRNSVSSTGSGGITGLEGTKREVENPQAIGELRKGPIKIYLYKDMVNEEHDWSTVAMSKFPTSICNRRGGPELEAFLNWVKQPRAPNCPPPAEDGDVEGSTVLLWNALELLVNAKGQMQTSPRTASGAQDGTFEAEVLRMLHASGLGGEVESNVDPCLYQDDQQDVNGEPKLASFGATTNQSQRDAMIEIERLLLVGECEAAVVTAVENSLWAQALILSHFVSTSAYRKVIEKFAASTYKDETVSKTLFSLIAGQGVASLGPGYPVVSKSPKDRKYGAIGISSNGVNSGSSVSGRSVPGTPRGGSMSPPAARATADLPLPPGVRPVKESWKRTLVGVLANRTPGDASTICAIGDRLLSEAGSVSAAHLCYLVAGVPVQSPVPSRIVLLGGDHKVTKPAEKGKFMTPESIIRTELWLYAKQLSSPHFTSTSFQPFRLMYAMWLADIGMTKEAKVWVDSIYDIVKQYGGTSVSSRRSGRSTVVGSNGPFTNHFKRQIKVFRDRLLGASGEPSEQQKSSWWPSLGIRIPSTGFRKSKAAEAGFATPSTEAKQPSSTTTTDPTPQNLEPSASSQSMQMPPPMGYSNGTGKARVMPPPQVDTATSNSNADEFGMSTPPVTQEASAPLPTTSSLPKPPTMFNPNAPAAPVKETPAEKPLSNGEATSETAAQKSESSSTGTENAEKVSPKSTSPSRKFKASGGMFSSMRNSLLNMLVPKPENAKTASLGKELEAYYDKEKKRWIFPGETEEEVAPPSAPPTSDPVPSKAEDSPSGTAAGGPGGPAAGGPSPSGPVYSAGKDILGTRSRYVAFSPYGNSKEDASSKNKQSNNNGTPPMGGINPTLPPGRSRGMTPPSHGKKGFTMFKPMVIAPKEKSSEESPAEVKEETATD